MEKDALTYPALQLRSPPEHFAEICKSFFRALQRRLDNRRFAALLLLSTHAAHRLGFALTDAVVQRH